MKLFFYILREYFKYVLATLFLCQFLFILFDFVHKSTGYFPRYKVAASTIFKFYAAQLPLQSVQILPITALIASVVTMVVLSRTNEITAMRAAGSGPWQIAMPLAAGGFILSLVAFIFGETLVPYASQKMHYIEAVVIEGHDTLGLHEKNNWLKVGDSVVHFTRYDSDNMAIAGLKIVNLDPTFRTREIIYAQHGYFQPGEKKWLLKDLVVWRWQGDILVDKTARTHWQVTLPLDPAKLKTDMRRPDEMGLREITSLIDQGQRFGKPVTSLKIAWHTKLAYALAALLVSFLGLDFAFRSERSTVLARSILIASGVGISYWVMLSACRALGGTGTLSPFFAAWVPDFFLMSIILFQILRLERS